MKKAIILISIVVVIVIAALVILPGILNKDKEVLYIDGIPLLEDNYIENDIISKSINRSTFEWLEYDDLERVEKDITNLMTKFKKALKANNASKIVKYFSESEREGYKSFFEDNSDVAEDLIYYLDDMEMIYLSKKTNSKETAASRLAEYEMRYDNNSISILFTYEDGDWYIKGF